MTLLNNILRATNLQLKKVVGRQKQVGGSMYKALEILIKDPLGTMGAIWDAAHALRCDLKVPPIPLLGWGNLKIDSKYD